MLTELNLYKFDSLVDKCRSDFQRQKQRQRHCTTCCMSAFDVTDAFTFLLLLFLLFSVLLLFYGLTPEIKTD